MISEISFWNWHFALNVKRLSIDTKENTEKEWLKRWNCTYSEQAIQYVDEIQMSQV